MEKLLGQVYQNLSKMLGLQRRLLELVRVERESLVQADRQVLAKIVQLKQNLVEEIYQAESERLKLTGDLAVWLKRPLRELTLPQLIIVIQGIDLKLAEQFRSTYHALTILVQRIRDQSRDNEQVIERSLSNILQMKKNILDESTGKARTYTSQGQSSSRGPSHHLISKEA